MRVAIDVSGLTGGLRSGTAVYLYRLAHALTAQRPDDEFELLYNGMPGKGAELANSLATPNARVTIAYYRWRPLPGPLFWRPYPRRLRAIVDRADLFHVGEFVFPRPRPGLPVVATVHDVTTKLYPQWHWYPNRILHHRRLHWIGRHATRVLVDAAATRADVGAYTGIAPERIDVAPLANGMGDATPVSSERVNSERERWGLGRAPYVLFVGTLEPRKNLVRLVRSFLSLSSDLAATRLVLAGAWGWRSGELRALLREPVTRSKVAVTGPIGEDSLRALYAGATVFAYPSLYEGFGLPVVEAMASGLPVITSRGGTLEEVAGRAAALVDPTDTSAISEALERLLRSPEERDRLRALGRERERCFTWQRTASLTFECYQKAMEQRR